MTRGAIYAEEPPPPDERYHGLVPPVQTSRLRMNPPTLAGVSAASGDASARRESPTQPSPVGLPEFSLGIGTQTLHLWRVLTSTVQCLRIMCWCVKTSTSCIYIGFETSTLNWCDSNFRVRISRNRGHGGTIPSTISTPINTIRESEEEEEEEESDRGKKARQLAETCSQLLAVRARRDGDGDLLAAGPLTQRIQQTFRSTLLRIVSGSVGLGAPTKLAGSPAARPSEAQAGSRPGSRPGSRLPSRSSPPGQARSEPSSC